MSFNLLCEAALLFAVSTPLLQAIMIQLSSKYPKTIPATKEFLVHKDHRNVIATPSLTYLPFRILGNIAGFAELIPGVLLSTFTVGVPVCLLHSLPSPYFDTVLVLLATLIIYEVCRQLKMPKCDPRDAEPSQ